MFYYDSSKNEFLPIPKAKCYVLSNDSFMSGWGYAKNKINTVVVPCESLEQAKKVEKYVESRSDQKYIRITTNKPRTKQHVLYSLELEWLKNI